MSPVRVLHVIDSMNPGGAQRVLLHLLLAMDPEDFACDVAVLHGPGPLSAEFEQSGLSPIHLARSKWDPRIPLRLRRIVRSKGYALVHAHLVPSTFVCETLRRGIGIPRLVAHVHNLYRRHEPLGYQNLLETALYRRVDAVVASSQTTLASLPAGPTPRVVVYNGLGVGTLDVLAHLPDRDAARRQLDLPAESVIAGAVGRVTPAKNHALLCQAAAALRDDVPGLLTLIVGDGPEAGAVATTVRSLGLEDQVRIAGYQPDVAPWLASMDMFIMPSSGEGFGMALIEAMAAAKPCVVPALPWAQEISVHDTTALHFSPNDPHDLAAQMRRLALEPETGRRLGLAAQEHVRRSFTAAMMAARTGDLYRQLLKGLAP